MEGLTRQKLSRLEGQANVREIPTQQCMVVQFPWRNPLSFIMGYIKVNPALAKHRSVHDYR